MDKVNGKPLPKFEKKIVPVLREGVEIVKMVLFKELRPYLAEKNPKKDSRYISQLTGAVVNELFGTLNPQEPFASFRKENKSQIKKTLKKIPKKFESLRIPLTDALRVQFLCDDHEGGGNESILTRAKETGVLMVERDIPLPKFFMNLVRRLGVAHQLLDAQSVEAIPEDDEALS